VLHYVKKKGKKEMAENQKKKEKGPVFDGVVGLKGTLDAEP
jgi:hypothetical protein